MNFSDVSYKSFVKSESEIITLFYDKFADIPLLSRMDAVAETFIDEIETLLNRDLPEEERIPLIENSGRCMRRWIFMFSTIVSEERGISDAAAAAVGEAETAV